MQEHELLFYLVEKTLHRLRFNHFIAISEAAVFVKKDDKTPQQHLLQVDLAFVTFYSDWEMSKDEPSRVCALFLKHIESYLRCIHRVRRQDFWMLEIEGRERLGAYKICGKTIT